MRDSMIFYRSFFEAIKELAPDVQAKIYNAIFEYSLNFNEVLLDGLPKTIFTLIKPQLDANNKRFENGKKGGRKKENNQKETITEPKRNQKETKTEANNNVNNNYNINCNINDNNFLLEKETKEENLSKENQTEIFPQSESVETGAEERKKVAQKKERSEEQLIMPDDFIEIWEEWKEYRKTNRFKSYAGLKWEQMAVDKLLELSNKDPLIAKLILRQTYENGYQGFFPLKAEMNSVANTNQSGFGHSKHNYNVGNSGKKSYRQILAERITNNGAPQNERVSGRSIVADRISQHLAQNSESGNHTIDIEANIV